MVLRRYNPWSLNEDDILGRGFEGIAYLAPDGTVIKITNNKNEIVLAKFLMENPDISPFLPKVFEITEESGNQKFPLGYRRENLEDLKFKFESDREVFFDFLFGDLRYGTFSALADEQLRKKWQKGLELVEDYQMNISPEAVNLYKSILEELIRLRKLGILIGDLREENFGMRKDGQVVIRDIGHGLVSKLSSKLMRRKNPRSLKPYQQLTFPFYREPLHPSQIKRLPLMTDLEFFWGAPEQIEDDRFWFRAFKALPGKPYQNYFHLYTWRPLRRASDLKQIIADCVGESFQTRSHGFHGKIVIQCCPDKFWDPMLEKCIKSRPRLGKRPLFYKVLIPEDDLARLLRIGKVRLAKQPVLGIKTHFKYLTTKGSLRLTKGSLRLTNRGLPSAKIRRNPENWKSVCCMCGIFLRGDESITDLKRISHGYCLPCKDKMMEEIKKFKQEGKISPKIEQRRNPESNLHLAYQHYQVDPNPETAFQFISEYLRVTDNATYLIGNDEVYLKDFDLLLNYMLATEQLHIPAELLLFKFSPQFLLPRVPEEDREQGRPFTLHGIKLQAIIEEITQNYKQYIGLFGENPGRDHSPEVDFIGWLSPNIQYGLDQLIIVFHTLRESIPNCETLHFWHGSYLYDESDKKYFLSKGLPPSIRIFRSVSEEHPGIVPLSNNLESALEDADRANQELREGIEEAQSNLDKEVLNHITEMASDLPRYTASQLRHMPTIHESHFANLKEEIYLDLNNFESEWGDVVLQLPEGPHIRVWLSRMTQDDGDEFNHPVEIEIINPVEGRWIEIDRYQS